MAQFPNLEHYRGDTFDAVEFEVKIDGIAVDLTDYAIKMQLRENYNKDIALELSLDNNKLALIDAINGKFNIVEQIIDIDGGIYLYDIEFNNNGVIDTFVKGNFEIIEDVTR